MPYSIHSTKQCSPSFSQSFGEGRAGRDGLERNSTPSLEKEESHRQIRAQKIYLSQVGLHPLLAPLWWSPCGFVEEDERNIKYFSWPYFIVIDSNHCCITGTVSIRTWTLETLMCQAWLPILNEPIKQTNNSEKQKKGDWFSLATLRRTEVQRYPFSSIHLLDLYMRVRLKYKARGTQK